MTTPSKFSDIVEILHIIPSMKTGGAEKMLVELLPKINDETTKCSLLLFDRTNTQFLASIKNAGISVEYTKSSSFFSPLNIFSFLRVLLSNKYDIIHCHLTYPQYWIAFMSFFNLKGKKLITTEHSSNNRRRGKKIFRILDKFVYSRFDKVISISPAAQNQLLEWIKPKNVSKFSVIENCVDIRKFREAIPIPRKEFKMEDSDIILVMVGRMTEAKDQSCLIKAMTLLDSKFKLILVGDGETLEENKNVAKKLDLTDRVFFCGARNDIPQILKMADYYVQASHWEGLPTAVLEAMASGLITMGADVPGVRDILPDDLLYRHSDYRELANLIGRISMSPFKSTILERQNQIVDSYDISYISDKHKNIYENGNRILS